MAWVSRVRIKPEDWDVINTVIEPGPAGPGDDATMVVLTGQIMFYDNAAGTPFQTDAAYVPRNPVHEAAVIVADQFEVRVPMGEIKPVVAGAGTFNAKLTAVGAIVLDRLHAAAQARGTIPVSAELGFVALAGRRLGLRAVPAAG